MHVPILLPIRARACLTAPARIPQSNVVILNQKKLGTSPSTFVDGPIEATARSRRATSTTLHANASHSSFHSADEIAVIIKQLRGEFEERIARANARPEGQADTRADAAIVRLRHRLARAERAAAELRDREHRRSKGSLDGGGAPPSATPATPPGSAPRSTASAPSPGSAPPRFHLADFRHDTDRDVMVCPAQQDLHLIGVYPTENGKGRYRLYGRSDCSDCALKARCTNAQKRRLKVSTEMEQPTTVPIGAAAVTPPIVPSPLSAAAVTPPISDATAPTHSPPTAGRIRAEERARPPAGPQASITEPEALMMLATSVKRWEPSYNADITVTRHGVIVNQFLTKRPTDYHSFEPALAAVSSTLKPPQSWVGDGHYGTHANLIAAAKAGVVLYAGSARAAARSEEAAPPEGVPPATSEEATPPEGVPPATTPTAIASPTDDAKTAVPAFRRADFRLDVERDLLVCPAGEELHFVGEYPTTNRLRRYRLYARSNCGGCLLKARCTEALGRRVKIIPGEPASGHEAGLVATDLPGDPAEASGHEAGLVAALPGDPAETSGPALDVLIREHEARMNDIGPNVMRFRGQTVEPVNSQLKQHGLGRLHVHGLARCGVVLALACIAHNLMKWKAREAARAMKKAA